jgi:hypothetical protein
MAAGGRLDWRLPIERVEAEAASAASALASARDGLLT